MNKVLLIGNPNCGKTTLFNALTGSHQRVGNWPGVTVEKKSGLVQWQEKTAELIDLPGVYSLLAHAEGISQDEQIAVHTLISEPAEGIINIVDASQLERHLYLTSQLLELGKPVVVVLNMMDVAAQRGIEINCTALAQQLGCPVIPIEAHRHKGVDAVRQAMMQLPSTPPPFCLPLSPLVQQQLTALEYHLLQQGLSATQAFYQARRWAEGDRLNEHYDATLAVAQPDLDIVMADARYQAVHAIAAAVQRKSSDASEHFTARVDRIVLHRFLALPLFLAMMYVMFLFAINVGGAFQDFFDLSTDTVFVQGTTWLLSQCHAPNWLIALLANGVGKGINTTLTFIPVIAAMFFFLSFLETSGYMARAAFVVDKLMRAMGLPGKSFVPMIVGFGCNVPAIMAARTLDSERDRLLTVMMSPFMSCSARLAIYAVFVAAFFPSGGQNVVFSLYLMGILMAVVTGFILRKTLLQGQGSPLILELPAYHWPSMHRLVKETALRLRFFVLRAGKLIIPICVILGALNAITLNGALNGADTSAQSLLAVVGQWLTPLFAPMGIHPDNWPATVGLLTGMLAKEVVVGTLNSLYAQAAPIASSFDLWAGLKAAVLTIPHNLGQLGSALANPVLASAADNPISHAVYGIMAQRFDGKAGAYAYLLFVLLYIPCVSTMAVIKQEASRKWMWLSVSWSLALAYAVAVIFYQATYLFINPIQSCLWIGGMVMGLAALVTGVYRFQHSRRGKHAFATA